MPNWKFWENQREELPPPAPPPVTGTSVRPRTDLPVSRAQPGTPQADQLDRLRRRREAVLFDVNQSELASEPDNPWRERVALLDQALVDVRSERARIEAVRLPAGRTLDPVPITDVEVLLGPPPTVSFTIGGERFHYEEEIDWAERGTQIARSELQMRSGDVAAVLPSDVADPDRERLIDHLTDSFFTLASDLRDRTIAGEPLPETITLADLAQPDVDNGGWLEWNGSSPEGARRQSLTRAIDAEEQRLLSERSRELEEMEKLADRLPIAHRRLADVDAEIAALGVDS